MASERLPTRRAVVVGSAMTLGAWAAPAVLQIDRVASASASCVPATFDWLDAIGRGNSAIGTFPVGGGVDITITENLDNVGCVDTTGQVSPLGTEFGGQPSWFELNLGDFDDHGCYEVRDFITTTFTFSRPVMDLAFTLFDVDRSGRGSDGFQDVIEIAATPSSSTPTYTFDPAQVSQSGNRFTGLTNASNGQTKNNVGVAYAGPISSLTFTFTAAPAPNGGDLTAQAVGVSNLAFCV